MMPLYEFQCQNCGKIEERRQAFSDDMPYCCGKFMERKISACNFTFGWRLTRKEEFAKLGKDDLVRNV